MYTGLPLFHGNALLLPRSARSPSTPSSPSPRGSRASGLLRDPLPPLRRGRVQRARRHDLDPAQAAARAPTTATTRCAPCCRPAARRPLARVRGALRREDHRVVRHGRRAGHPAQRRGQGRLDGQVGISGVEFRVVGDDDQPLPPARSASSSSGIRPAGSRTTTSSTRRPRPPTAAAGSTLGDLAEVDDEGFFYYKGRKKESMRAPAARTSPRGRSRRCSTRTPRCSTRAAHAIQSELGEDEVKVCVVVRAGEQPAPERDPRLLRRRDGRVTPSRATSSSSTSCRRPPRSATSTPH